MKRTFILFALCVACTRVCATLTVEQRLSSLCRVWGFLKYYHPAAGTGKIDWDQQFMMRAGAVRSAASAEELSAIYTTWIRELGDVPTHKGAGNFKKDTSDKNYDMSWMDDREVFSDSLIAALHHIEQNKSGRKNHYVKRHFPQMNPSFRTEKQYPDSVMPSVNMRMLALARYWNIVQYYFPYKHITDTAWDRVLDKMIPVFAEATDTLTYIRAIAALIAHTNDSHGMLAMPQSMANMRQARTIPAGYTIIGNKAVINRIFNDSMATRDDIRYGDVILGVNGRSVDEIVAERWKYISASNRPVMLSRLGATSRLTFGDSDTVNITFERGGSTFSKTVHRYYIPEMHYNWAQKAPKEHVKLLNGNIGYLDLDVLRHKQVKGAMKKVAHTDALIIDVRNYPRMTLYALAKHLVGEKKQFVQFAQPVWEHPGHFRKKSIYKCGSRTHKRYKGKVIVLLNESTQSHAEFTCMALQTVPGVTCIGSQTAGADGDVARVILPGGYSTNMTSLGIYYPDGRPTQRIGIVPDIVVRPTIEGIRQKKDEVLERAILFATSGK